MKDINVYGNLAEPFDCPSGSIWGKRFWATSWGWHDFLDDAINVRGVVYIKDGTPGNRVDERVIDFAELSKANQAEVARAIAETLGEEINQRQTWINKFAKAVTQ